MNIQMLLSALPTAHSGTPQPGAASGHFALALGQAAQATTLHHGDTAALDTALPEGLPSDLTGRNALLQALHAAGYSLNGDGEANESNAQLDDIMQRLELIATDHGQLPSGDEAVALVLPPEIDDIAKGVADSIHASAAATGETEVMPQALVAEATNVELRQQFAVTQGGLRGSLGRDAPLHSAPLHSAPLHSAPTAESLASAIQAGGQRAALSSAEARAADTPAVTPLAHTDAKTRPTDTAVVTTQARAGAIQAPAGDLAQLNPEAPRGNFMPEAITSTTATSIATGQGTSPAQPALPAQTTLSAPVQSQAWSSQLGQQLVQFARQGGEQRIEMRLTPAELGPLSVTLKMTEQGAQAQFLSAHAAVRQVLEQAIPQLREALAEQGITLGETSVGEQRQQDAQAFAGGHSGQGQRGAATNADLDLVDNQTLTSSPDATVALEGRVDLYA